MKMSDECLNDDEDRVVTQSMASARGETPADYDHNWEVKVDSTSITSNSNIDSTGGVDQINSYPDNSPTHQTSLYSLESMQAAYQSSYGVNPAAAAAAFPLQSYYSQMSPYGSVISQSYNGSRSIGSKPGSSALAAQAAYLNNAYPFTSSQTAQNPYCSGQYSSSFSNTGANPQSLSTCQQSYDYPTYQSFNHTSGYAPYGYSNYGYIPNASTVNNGSPSPSSMTMSSGVNPSSAATYQLTQLPDNDSLHYAHIDDCPSPVKTDTHQNSVIVSSKKGTTKPRGRGRRQPNPSPDPENNLERVFVWDLDETIILYLSLLKEESNCNYNPMTNSVSEVGMQLEQLINHFAENHFFYNDLEEVDQIHVDDTASDDNGQDLSNYNFQTDGFHTSGACGGPSLGLPPAVRGGVDWLRKMAFRYRRIKEIYTQYRDNVGGLLSPQERESLYKIQQKWDQITDHWTTIAHKSLQLINSRPRNVNVLVTNIQLVPTLAKVMIFGLAPNFNIENIYSACKIGKDSVFERIVNRFGKKCTYVVIGDGIEEQKAAEKLTLPHWPVHNRQDLISLHHALDLGHL